MLAFDSTATDLAADPNGAVRDVFVRDLGTRATRLVSRPAAGGGADGPSDSAVLSGSGVLVAFVSAATNLVDGDANGRRDVFTRNGLNPPVRVSAPPGGEADGDSSRPDVSRDGRTLVFASQATNLVPGDGNGAGDIFAYDVRTRALRRIAQPPGEEADGVSSNPSISPDGRYVAFESAASNLVAGDRNRRPDVFLCDLATGVIERVSVSSGGEAQNQAVAAPFAQIADVSEGGRHVAFDSDATNLVRRDSNRDTDIFVRDRAKGTTRRVSLSSTGRQGGNDSFAPTITASGRHVAFESFAEDLAPGDARGEDIFVADVRARTTVVADVTSRGARPRGPERVRQLLQRPVLSDSARLVAFTSTAADLVRGDANRSEDVFVRDMTPPRGGFVHAPPRVGRDTQPTLTLGADDPAARLFLCRIDSARRICGLRTRLPALRPGRHVLRVSAGGPGMLYSPKASTRRFRIAP